MSATPQDGSVVLSELLLGLVQKIPLSSVSQSAYHVLKIDARLPAPVRDVPTSPAASSASASSGSWVERTFEAPLQSGSKAFVHVQTRFAGDVEELVVQALRVSDAASLSSAGGVMSARSVRSLPPSAAPASADLLFPVAPYDLQQGAGGGHTGHAGHAGHAGQVRTNRSDSRQVAVSSGAGSAYRIVYHLRLRDTTASGVEAYAIHLDSAENGAFSMLWSHELREKHLHSDPRLRALDGTGGTPLIEALSDTTNTLRTEQLTAPRLELAALNQSSTSDAHLLEDWSVLAADALDHEAPKPESEHFLKASSSTDEANFFHASGNDSSSSSSSSSSSLSSSSDASDGDSSNDMMFEADDTAEKSTRDAEHGRAAVDDVDVQGLHFAQFFYNDVPAEALPTATPPPTAASAALESAYFEDDETLPPPSVPRAAVAQDSAYFEDDEALPPSSTVVAVPRAAELPPVAASAAEHAHHARDWTAEFHQILQEVDPSVRVRKMAQYARHFTHVATRIARTIVAEEHLPASRRTMLPTLSVKGVAGGEKFVVSNMFLKFARDVYSLYGSEETASKAAALELHGLNAILNARVSEVYLPMVCVVDDLGARVVAASMLPIGTQTLLHGVDDGGAGLRRARNASTTSGESSGAASDAFSGPRSKSVAGEGQAIRDRIRRVARVLNLKAHRLRGSNETTFFGSDVEWHLSWNKRLYVVDCARVFPPEAPGDGGGGHRSDHLTKQLRAEFVARYGSPLNPDTFSSFLDERDRADNDEIVRATVYLTQRVVPDFAIYLYHDLDGGERETERALDSQRLVREMHARGINLRQLGRVRYWLRQAGLHKQNEPGGADAFDKLRALSVNDDLRASAGMFQKRGRCELATLCEMAARVLVGLTRSAWRMCRRKSLHPRTQCKRVAVLLLNFLFVPRWMALSHTSVDDPSLVALCNHRNAFWLSYDADGCASAAPAFDGDEHADSANDDSASERSTSHEHVGRHMRANAAASAAVWQHVRGAGIKTLIARKYGVLAISRTERSAAYDLRDSLCLGTVRSIMCRKLGLVFDAVADTPNASDGEPATSEPLSASGTTVGDRDHNDDDDDDNGASRAPVELLKSTSELPPPTPDEGSGDERASETVPVPTTVPLQTRGGIGSGGDESPRRIFLHASVAPDSASSRNRTTSRLLSTHAAALGADFVLVDKVPRFGWKFDDLVSLEPVQKHLCYVAYYEAFANAHRALSLKRRMWRAHVTELSPTDAEGASATPLFSGNLSPSVASSGVLFDAETLAAAAERAFGRAYASFDEALRASPSDTHAMVAFARFLAEWASLTADNADATRLWELADTHFATAHRMAPNDSFPLLNWANQVLGSVYDHLTAAAVRRLSGKQRALLDAVPDRLVSESLAAAPPQPPQQQQSLKIGKNNQQ